ncbi:DUF3558 domain-containing protein [Amycolatopsis sp.]|uniref:DUF3558 domain-containing protein n=1 Tax=Amycolatopsis sp. TaxID=37632 RepID=UPI002E19C308
MSIRLKYVAGGMLATAVLTSCTSTDEGQAYVVPTAESSASQSAKAAGLPQRPSELKLTGIDPCTLLTPEQLDQLKVNSKPRQARESADGPSCSFDVDLTRPYYSYGITAVTKADLDAWLTGDRRKNSMTTEPAGVGGFPALKNFRKSSDPSDCQTLVGVAAGQTIVVQAFPVTQGAFNQQQLCDLSTQAANLALQTLKAHG